LPVSKGYERVVVVEENCMANRKRSLTTEKYAGHLTEKCQF
jgi:hypothetical protein